MGGGGIPRVDKYSFTAGGEPWVVQSWLVTAAYGFAHRLGDVAGVVVLHGLIYAGLGVLVASLARTGQSRRTMLAAGLAIGLGVPMWSPRPLAVGLVCFALLVTVVERKWSPWWLVPLGWVWVNSHGSFALGLAWVVARVVGEWFDARGSRSGIRTAGYSPPFVYQNGFALGLAAGAINPLGPRLLAFPLTVLTKRESFARVIEWRAPSFAGPVGLFTVACLVGIVLVLVTSRRRLGWADALPMAGLLAAGLIAQRNLAVAAIAAAPVLARVLHADPAGSGDIRAQNKLHLALGAGIAALAALFVAVAAGRPGLDLDGYPVRTLAALGDQPRLLTTDIVGGYRILIDGKAAEVFIDDRVDMYPIAVTRDYLTLFDGKPGALKLLDRYNVDVVVWPSDAPLTALLVGDDRWERRRSAEAGWRTFRRL